MAGIVHKIEKLLEAKKLSKTDFAKKIGVHRDTVYNWTDDNMKVTVLLKISDYLEYPIEDFLKLYSSSQVNEPVEKYGKANSQECIEAKTEARIFKQLYETDRAALKMLAESYALLNEKFTIASANQKQAKTKQHG